MLFSNSKKTWSIIFLYFKNLLKDIYANYIEVIGDHVLEGITNWSIYDFVCYKCKEVFTQQVLTP